MREFSRLTLLVFALALASCESDTTVPAIPTGLRVVNAFTGPVDVLIDGNVAISAMAAGTIETTNPSNGTHTVIFRQSTGTTSQLQVTTAKGSMPSIAAIRSSTGAVGNVALDDTNSTVLSGKTKVRVLHLAANAGTLQVYRTQPDFPTPTQWQFPFNYQTDISSQAAPFFESTVGTWEVRAWQTPADASGWASATAKMTIPLASGEKKTVVILDKTGGGVRLEIF
jgi:hypothetical protein